MDIKKISWTPKNGMKVSYDIAENDESVSYVKKSDAVPTMDFQNALVAIRPHLIALTEYLSFAEAKGDYEGFEDVINTFTATEIQLSGEGEEEKVVIIGKKELVNQLTIPVKTLKTALYNTDDYEYSGNLAEVIDTLVEETKLYLGGKHQDRPVQLQMELIDKEEDVVEVEDEL